MDESLYWTKIAAIGQVAGALATFLAAGVALQLGRTERQLRLRVTASFQTIVSSRQSVQVMCVQVENIGMRTARVDSFGWATGFANSLWILPSWLRLRSAHQMPDYEWVINKDFPWTLEPGQTQSTYMRRPEFLEALSAPHEQGIFRSWQVFKKPFLLRLRVYVGVATMQKVCFGTVDPKIVRALTETYRSRNGTNEPGDEI